jgi:hypothetical protein
LTAPAIYHDKEHVLATDNWYTSMDVAKLVQEEPRKMHFVGTCKSNKRGIPKNAKGVQAKFGLFQKQKAKGQVFPVVKKDRGASQETGT